MNLWKRLLAVASLAFIFGCHENNPTVKADGQLPQCRATGESYSRQQVMQLALDNFVHRYNPLCRAYASHADLVSRNPGCCNIQYNKTTFHDQDGEELTVDQIPEIGKKGFLIGRLTIVYYCGSPIDGSDRRSTSTVTSCGELVNETSANNAVYEPYLYQTH
jgi:hypothetical protein